MEVYMAYSFDRAAYKIGVSNDPEYRVSELRWSANNPWGCVITTHLCEHWYFPKSVALTVESVALERTKINAVGSSEWRKNRYGSKTIDGLLDTYRFINDVKTQFDSSRSCE